MHGGDIGCSEELMFLDQAGLLAWASRELMARFEEYPAHRAHRQEIYELMEQYCNHRKIDGTSAIVWNGRSNSCDPICRCDFCYTYFDRWPEDHLDG